MAAPTSNSIVITNLPSNISTYDLAFQFGEIGLIKRNYLEKNEAKQFTGTAHITYFNPAHAVEAAQKFNNTDFKSNKLSVTVAAPRPQIDLSVSSSPQNGLKRKISEVEKVKNAESSLKKKKEDGSGADIKVSNGTETPKSPKKKKKKNIEKQPKENSDIVQKKIKVEKKYNKEQPGRLIVRNIPFKATEKDLMKLFEPHGKVEEVKLLKHPNPTFAHKGLGFVQYSTHEEAVEAIKKCNLHKLKDRQIAVDHAVPKAKFQHNKPKVEDLKPEPKQDPDSKEVFAVPDERVPVKDTKKESVDLSLVKHEVESVCDDTGDHFKNFWPSKKQKAGKQDPDDCSIVDEKPHIGLVKSEEETRRVPIKAVSRDVEEGRSVFVSKLSLDTAACDLEAVLAKFGEVKKTMLVTDKLTEQSRGCAFVQFKSSEGAQACLDAAEDPSRRGELTVDGRVVMVRLSLAREALRGPDNKETTKAKDNRNLYLAREGFIREGTIAAKDVSAADVQLRRAREQVKERLLSNLHMFVSPLRLVVHNLPLHLTDAQLKQVFIKHAPPKARVVESRIMRDLKAVEGGVAKSCGYGFVAFTRHEDALAALRAINNNPDIFTPSRRPVVEFSIENLNVLKSKLKRAEKSSETSKKAKSSFSGKNLLLTKTVATPPSSTGPLPTFAGLASQKLAVKPGKKLHVHLGPKFRHRDQARGSKKPAGKPSGKNFRANKKNQLRKPTFKGNKVPNRNRPSSK
ncbi:RNA recognition motif domain [Trinorchestia longiramus]|nr:RNA recognition motif domain [Trinorchestia longiramus]